MSKVKIVILALMVVLLAGYGALLRWFAPEYLQKQLPLISAVAQEYLNGTIEIGSLKVSPALELAAGDVVVYDANGHKAATAETILVKFSFWRGLFSLDPVAALDTITVDRPVFYLRMDAEEHWNVGTLLKERKEGGSAFRGLVRIVDGRGEVSSSYDNFTFGIKGTVDAAENPYYELKFDLTPEGETWLLAGRVNTKAEGSIFLQAGQVDLGRFSGFAERYLAIKGTKGQVRDLNLVWRGSTAKFSVEGGGRLADAGAAVALNGQDLPVVLNGQVKFTGQEAQAQNLLATINGERVRLNGKVDFADTEQPQAKDLLVELLAFTPQKVMRELPVAGSVSGSVLLNGTLDKYTGEGVLTSPQLSYEGRTISQVRVPLSVTEENITVPGLSFAYGGGTVTAVGSYLWQDGTVRAAVEMKAVDLSETLALPQSAVLSGELLVQGHVSTDKMQLSLLMQEADASIAGTALTGLRLNADYDAGDVLLHNFSFLLGSGMVAAEGSLRSGQLDLRAAVLDSELRPFLALAGQEGRGMLTGGFKISGTLAAPEAEGDISLKDANLLGQEINNAHGAFSWHQKKLALHEIVVNMDQGYHRVDGWLDFADFNNPVLDISILTKGVRVEPLLAAAGQEIPLTGNLDNTLSVFGTLNAPVVNGSMRLYEGSYNKFLLDEITGEYSYGNDELGLLGFVIKTPETTVKVDGRVYNGNQLDIKLAAEQVDLSRFPLPDTMKITGFADFRGSLLGTTDTPVFMGSFTASSVFFNGQELNALSGTLESVAGKVNRLEGRAEQAGGVFSIKMLLDIPNSFLQGNINVEGGELKTLLAMGGLNYDVGGRLYGDIVINREGKGSGITADGKIMDFSVRDIKYNSTEFDLRLQENILYVNKMRVEEPTGGFLATQGKIDFRERGIDMEIFASEANAAILTSFMHNPVQFGGKMNFAAQVSGTLENPEANASLSIGPGSVADITFDNLYGMLTLRDDVFNLDQLFIQKDIYKASAYGSLPYDLLRAKADRRNPEATMSIRMKLDNANLEILPSLSKNVEAGTGATTGELLLTGTLEDPLLDGSFAIKDGRVKFKQIKTSIENINLAVVFEGRRLRLDNLSAQVGAKGSVTAKGTLALFDAGPEAYALDVKAENAQVESDIFSGIINGQIRVAPQRDRPLVAGNIRLDKVLINMPTIPEMAAGESNIGLDLTVDLGPEIHLYNKYLYDLWLAGNLKIQGSTRFTNIDGSLTATKGTVTYLRTPFKIRKATAGFPTPGSVLPNISMDAYAKFSRYNVNMKIDGPLDQMDLTLTSDPPLSQQAIFRMLTLKRYASGGEVSDGKGLEGEDLQNMLDLGLEMTFLSDVEALFREELQLDQFRIYSGNTASGIGFEVNAKEGGEFAKEEREQYNVLLGKYVTDKVLLGYVSSLDGQYHNVFAQYEIDKHIVLNFSLDEDNKTWYGVEYQITF